MSVAKRIIKNTGFLYAKMAITVFISLYTTRLLLDSLGESDFGIFNIIGGSIVMLGFLNSTMANASQRFMSYAEGGGDLEMKRRVFSVCLLLHIGVAFLTLILLFSAMYPLFHGVLNIVPDRIYAAKIVYCSTIFSTLLTIVNVPYDAVMNAHENMLYYSVIGIFESLLKLVVAFFCVYTDQDKLVVYGVLMALIPLITLTIMKVYCHRHYAECQMDFRKYWDIGLMKQIAFFSGWNFLTAISSLLSFQGIGLVLNHFYGTMLNAAQGVAQQLNGHLSSFSLNLLKALNPVIVKSAGAHDTQQMNVVTLAGCKYSTCLILFFGIPFVLEMKFILSFWLINVPAWSEVFCVLQIIQTVICQMANPVSTAVYAQGEIKGYALYKSLTNVLPLLLTYCAFRMGASPYWLYIPMIAVWAIGGNIVVVYYAKKKCQLMVKTYKREVVLPVMGVAFFMFLLGGLAPLFLPSNFARLIFTGMLTTLGMLLSMWCFGMRPTEKTQLIHIFQSFINRKKRR